MDRFLLGQSTQSDDSRKFPQHRPFGIEHRTHLLSQTDGLCSVPYRPPSLHRLESVDNHANHMTAAVIATKEAKRSASLS